MKIFIKKTILFLLLTVLFIETISAIFILTKVYLIAYPGKEIYHVIKKSKEKNKSKKLLIADSVGRQMFSYKENIYGINSLATNQAIGMVGQYLLLNNYLNAGNEIDTLIILFNPTSFKNNLDQNYTYHYFLKPFYKKEYSSLFSKTVQEQIRKIPYRQFVWIPHIQVSSWAPEFESSDIPKYTFLSPISAEYLSKIKALSIENNFDIIISPTPTNINKKNFIENINIDELPPTHLEKQFNDYFNNIIYLDSTNFVDGIHLIHPEKYTNKFKTEYFR